MTPETLSGALLRGLARLHAAGTVPLQGGLPALPQAVLVTPQRTRARGDYASNVALQIASALGMEAADLAALLAAELEQEPEVHQVLVDGPGFLNITLRPGAQGEIARQVVSLDTAYGRPSTPLLHPLACPAPRVATARYEHSRAASLLRNAGDLGIDVSIEDVDATLLCHPREGDVLRLLGGLPPTVEAAVRRDDATVLVRYLDDLSEAFVRFREACDVLPRGSEAFEPVHGARLLLAAAVRVVLANGLTVLGVDAPERI